MNLGLRDAPVETTPIDRWRDAMPSAARASGPQPLAASMRRALRILHTENSMAWGGQEVRILTEARGLLDRGHAVELLVCPGSPIGAEAERMGIPCDYVDIGTKSPASLVRLRRWFHRRAMRFDVVNTHSSTDSWVTAVTVATMRDAPPLIRTRHVSTPVNDHLTTRWLYLAATTHIVTTGEALRRQLHRDNGYPLARMTSVRTGIDLARFRPQLRRSARARLNLPDGPTLGVLATLRSWKGHADLLRAFGLLRGRFPRWQLLLIGDGPQRRSLEVMSRDLGLGDAVRFVGNTRDAPTWLASLDLFVLPSYGDEGVPQSIMQAMACGLAVVSTTVGAIGEALQPNWTGLMVEPRSPVLLAEALARLMSDDALRQRMASAGLDYAREHFDIEVMLDRMEGVFHRHAMRARGISGEAVAPATSAVGVGR